MARDRRSCKARRVWAFERRPLLCQDSYVAIVMKTYTTEPLMSEPRTIGTEMSEGAERGNSTGELVEDV